MKSNEGTNLKKKTLQRANSASRFSNDLMKKNNSSNEMERPMTSYQSSHYMIPPQDRKPRVSICIDPVEARSARRIVNAQATEMKQQALDIDHLVDDNVEEVEEKESDELYFTLKKLSATGVESDVEVEREAWPASHIKLLYIISKYAVCALTEKDQESWIRSIPLLVLIYEGITAGLLDFDYAPNSVLISRDGISKRSWLNVSQDGKSAVDDMRESALVNGLKLSTEDFQPVTAFQVSSRGCKLLEQLSQDIKDKVNEIIYAPNKVNLLQVRFVPSDDELFEKEKMENVNQGMFVLESGSFFRWSKVTDTEDVSYVSSPFLPNCVRNQALFRDFTSNAHRSHEASAGDDNIRDELNETIILSYPICLIAEWIPFGANQIVALNRRLGALERCQGGLFTSLIDDKPTETQFEIPPGLTQVTILDYDFVRFINFEAEINFPEEDGIVQIENFGMHLNVDGTILYGIEVEAIMNRKPDNISIDHLTRLLVDVHQDSSEIMNDLLSSYQLSLLEMIFMGDLDNRGKFNLIFANEVEPFLPAKEYLDRGDFENELKQVLGEIHDAHDIGEDGLMIVGRNGILVTGSCVINYEELWVCYVSLLCREMFLRTFFIRTFILDDVLKSVRQLVLNYARDPNNIGLIRFKLNAASRDVILLEETLGYLSESLEHMNFPEAPSKDKVGEQIYSLIDVKSQHHDVVLRTRDLQKLVRGAQHELKNLQQMTDIMNTKLLEDVFKSVESNTKTLVDASAANERASASLEVMQVILAGSFAFDLIDRLSGGTLNISVPDWVNVYLKAPIIEVPFLWFFLNMVWLVGVSFGLIRLMRFLGEQANGVLTLRVSVNRPIDIKSLDCYLAEKKIQVSDCVTETVLTAQKTTWVETNKTLWQGEPPKIELQYEKTYGFLLVVLFQLNARNSKLTEDEFLQILYKDMSKFPIFI